jgi:hypothetical protein
MSAASMGSQVTAPASRAAVSACSRARKNSSLSQGAACTSTSAPIFSRSDRVKAVRTQWLRCTRSRSSSQVASATASTPSTWRRSVPSSIP